ncbi:hypothetical protein ACQ4LE_010321 [Meloidogyne hapla]
MDRRFNYIKRGSVFNFDIDGALAERKENVTILINEQIDSFGAISDDREFNEKFNKLFKLHHDKIKNVTDDKDKHKIVCEFKERVKKINRECHLQSEKSEILKGKIDHLDSILRELKEPIREEEVYKMRKAALNI